MIAFLHLYPFACCLLYPAYTLAATEWKLYGNERKPSEPKEELAWQWKSFISPKRIWTNGGEKKINPMNKLYGVQMCSVCLALRVWAIIKRLLIYLGYRSCATLSLSSSAGSIIFQFRCSGHLGELQSLCSVHTAENGSRCKIEIDFNYKYFSFMKLTT